MTLPGNAWYQRFRPVAGGRWEVCCYENDLRPDGSTVGPDDPGVSAPDSDRLWEATLDAESRVNIRVTERGAPGAPDAWFVAMRSKEQDRPRITIVAFATHHLPDGTVVPEPAFFTMPVRSSEQAGAIRWWADTAVVDEIFVQPAHRRGHLGIKLIYTASGYHQMHGWPDRLHSDGRRTDLGQEFVVGLRHPSRIAPWTEKAAPMDRPDSGATPEGE